MTLFSLNQQTLDVDTLNSGSHELTDIDNCKGEFNANVFNAQDLNDCVEFFQPLLIPSEYIVTFSQTVGILADGECIRFSQNVQLLADINGTIVTFSQDVRVVLSESPVITFSQSVENSSVASFFDIYGWDIIVLINNRLLPSTAIWGDLSISKTSNTDSLCKLKVHVNDPYSFLYDNDGGDIVIKYRSSTSTNFNPLLSSLDPLGWHTVFTGKLDIPELNLIEKYVVLNCSNRRLATILDELPTILPTIGRYSPDIQGTITNIETELNYRLSTVPMDVDLDSYNNLLLNSWYIKRFNLLLRFIIRFFK